MLCLGDDEERISRSVGRSCDREYDPRWSPDGSMFVYWRDPYDDEGPMGTAVYTLDVSGGHERQLTRPSMNAGSASWSPDGRWIVFSTYPLGEYDCCEVSNLYRMHPDGSRMEQLTHYRSDDFRATQPRYTPDGGGSSSRVCPLPAGRSG
jgi:Tol biopolymer transport system component